MQLAQILEDVNTIIIIFDNSQDYHNWDNMNVFLIMQDLELKYEEDRSLKTLKDIKDTKEFFCLLIDDSNNRLALELIVAKDKGQGDASKLQVDHEILFSNVRNEDFETATNEGNVCLESAI